MKKVAVGGLIGALVAQPFFGSSSDFYEYRFILKRDIDPDDLASFYGSEEFMEIFCILPIVGQIMMRGGYFDDDGVVHTMGVPGELLVSMAFTDEMNDEGRTAWFNKRERFKDVFLGAKMWDQVSNFGFHTLDDGKIEVYHHGEYFVGRLPLISLGVKTAFQVQGAVVAWATEHHLNHRAFINETEEEEELEHLSRTNHILYFLKYHVWKDIKTGLGILKEEDKKDTSFLSVKDEEYDEEEEVEEIVLPIKRLQTMRKIEDSLNMDKENNIDKEDLEALEKEDNTAYQLAQKIALVKHKTLQQFKNFQTRKIENSLKMDKEMVIGKEEAEALVQDNDSAFEKARKVAIHKHKTLRLVPRKTTQTINT